MLFLFHSSEITLTTVHSRNKSVKWVQTCARG